MPIALLQTGSYNFSPTELAQVDTALGNINPELPALFTNDGIITDPAYEAYTGTGPLDAVYGGYDPNLVGTDLVTLFQDSLSSPTDPTLSTDLSTLANDFTFPGDAANLAALLAGDPVAASASCHRSHRPVGGLQQLAGEPGRHRGLGRAVAVAERPEYAIRCRVCQPAAGLVLSSSALDADGPPAQRWGSDCYAASALGVADAEGITAAALRREARRHDAVPHAVAQQRPSQHGGFAGRPDDVAGFRDSWP